jgi:hypothetical protein
VRGVGRGPEGGASQSSVEQHKASQPGWILAQSPRCSPPPHVHGKLNIEHTTLNRLHGRTTYPVECAGAPLQLVAVVGVLSSVHDSMYPPVAPPTSEAAANAATTSTQIVCRKGTARDASESQRAGGSTSPPPARPLQKASFFQRNRRRSATAAAVLSGKDEASITHILYRPRIGICCQ